MSLVKEYFELTKKYQSEYGENTILLMQVGAFFEVYGMKSSDIIIGSNILKFSQICELNMVDKNSTDIVMAGFKDIQIEKYIKKIQDAGFTAVVYTQDESAKNTTRSLAGIFSPGTYFNNDVQLSNSITCIWIDLIENKILMKGKYVVVGMANIDIYTGKTDIYQFKETYLNSPTTYDELEHFISIFNPSETIIITNFTNENEINNVINYAGINSSLIHKLNINTIKDDVLLKRIQNCEKQSYQKEILSTFYKFDKYEIFLQNFYENNIATQAFCYLLDFVYQHNPHLVRKVAEPSFKNCSNKMLLANHSLKQLHIIDDGTVKSSKRSCVSQMLNDCLTPMGKRKFLNNILNPIYNKEFLQKEYDITDYFLSKYEEYNNFLRTRLSMIHDISKLERKIYLKKISPNDFYHLYNNIITSKQIYEKLEDDPAIMSYVNINILQSCDEISSFIELHLDLTIAQNVDQERNFDINFIKMGIDENLDAKTLLLQESELKLQAIAVYLSSLIKESKTNTLDYIKIHETEKNHYGLILTSRRCKLLVEALPIEPTSVTLSIPNTKVFEFTISKKQFEYIKQGASNNFIMDEQINTLCKTITSIKISLKDIITSVYNTFVEKVEQYQSKIEYIIYFITSIDLLYTKASLAKKYNYCKPQIIKSDKSCVSAKKLRHCLVEQFDTDELYVTNDLHLGDNETNGILLFGTNAVGKTTIIRALGIAVIMAQAGLYVPCSEFTFNPYKYLFTRIIGNDNIFKGLSTFVSEMSELRTILRLCDENSLILGDELCSGTETPSAVGIFVSGINTLHENKSSFIFATHLHEIVDYDEIVSLTSLKCKHLSVIYDAKRDILVYDRLLKDGSGDTMYGLEVCKSLKLPRAFIDYAYEIRNKYYPEQGSILSLNTSRYNSKKIVGICEKCGTHMGTEIHHKNHQSEATKDGFISTTKSVFHKNDVANLMTVCNRCHKEEHSNKCSSV
jgi:DNA mismatch repair protein MutS